MSPALVCLLIFNFGRLLFQIGWCAWGLAYNGHVCAHRALLAAILSMLLELIAVWEAGSTQASVVTVRAEKERQGRNGDLLGSGGEGSRLRWQHLSPFPPPLHTSDLCLLNSRHGCKETHSGSGRFSWGKQRKVHFH